MTNHHAAQRKRARKAIGAAVLAGGILLAGPAGIAIAAPGTGPGTDNGGTTGPPGGGPTPGGGPGDPGPGGPGDCPGGCSTNTIQGAVTDYQHSLNTAITDLNTATNRQQRRAAITEIRTANQQFRSSITTIVIRRR